MSGLQWSDRFPKKSFAGMRSVVSDVLKGVLSTYALPSLALPRYLAHKMGPVELREVMPLVGMKQRWRMSKCRDSGSFAPCAGNETSPNGGR